VENNKLFSEFEAISSKQWKQQIQYELKGADYNETLVWESPDGIKVKPFYHLDENSNFNSPPIPKNPFEIVQNIFVFDVQKSNQRALESLNKGAESIRFIIDNEAIIIEELLKNCNQIKATFYFDLKFISIDFATKIAEFAKKNSLNCILLQDVIGNLSKEGNWYENKENDFEKLKQIASLDISSITVNSTIYLNAGATIVQQLGYTLAHLNEYFNEIHTFKKQITIEVAIGANYFFEIAKLRALRLIINALTKEYNFEIECTILAIPSKRNKTIYDYNVNMLRTTTECMAAILGGANAISNLPYDAIYHKDNEFADRIARNQLLILKHESYFDKVANPADGAYYIEELTNQLAEKALFLFKDIEKNGGFLSQLIEGTIQRKIQESASKEQDAFDNNKEILLGTNKYPNKNDAMKNELELFPFVKQKTRKTIITPIIEKRLAEKLEQDRLALEG